MKTDIREVVTRTSNANRETVKMSIDAENIAHILRIANNLYADPASACIREYAANGMDSHIVAGQTRPIEVTLPTYENPTLVIQDWGTGMSKNDITTIYSKYGASTKRETDELIGAFGLGCKAALSMTPSFVLTSVKDNVKVIAIIHRGEDGVGSIEFVNEMPTTDANGVTVSIPVTDKINEYETKARAIFITWKKDSVLINGLAPKMSVSSESDFLPLGDLAYLSRLDAANNGYSYRANGQMIVNMGGIGYIVDREQSSSLLNSIGEHDVKGVNGEALQQIKRSLSYNLTLVLNIPIGNVTLVPSRESVQWTNKSTAAVRKHIIETINYLPIALEADFADCKTHVEVLSKEVASFANNFRAIYANVKWQGKSLPDNMEFAYAHIDNYNDDTVDTYTISYADEARVPMRRNTRSRRFSFGFVDATERSFDLSGKNAAGSDSKQWVFVKVDDSEDFRKNVAGYFNSYLAHQRQTLGKAYNSTVVVGYTGDIFANEWFKAVFDSKKNTSTMIKVTVDDIVTTAKAFRKANRNYVSTASGNSYIRTAVRYETYTMDNKGNLTSGSETATEINEKVATNGYNVYLDNLKFITENYNSNWNRVKTFLPQGSVVVSVGQNRKFEALEKRIDATPMNLADDISAAVNAFLPTVEIRDYFHSRRNPFLNSIQNVTSYLDKLDDGYLKSMLVSNKALQEKSSKLSDATSLVGHHLLTVDGANMTWEKDYDDVATKIMNSFPMVWNASRSYNYSADDYTLSVIEYLNYKREEIDAIFKAAEK